MGLIRKNPFNTENNKPLYTLGLSTTVILVGLGNDGAKYQNTRHNIGFACLDQFIKVQNMESWIHKKDLKSHVSTGTVGSTRVIAIKPTTMMNLSGEAVQAVSAYYKVQTNNLIVVHDELDVVFGHIRCRMGGGAAGNNGVKSIIQHLGEEFGRVRVGIGPKTPEQIDSADFVLGTFNQTEQKTVPLILQEVTALLTEFVATTQVPHDTRNVLF